MTQTFSELQIPRSHPNPRSGVLGSRSLGMTTALADRVFSVGMRKLAASS